MSNGSGDRYGKIGAIAGVAGVVVAIGALFYTWLQIDRAGVEAMTKFRAGVKQNAEAIEELKGQLPGAKGEPGKPGPPGPAGPTGPAGALPSGAVIAFDLATGCPDGWTNLSESEPNRFARRTIVAMDLNDNSSSLYGYGETGGEEEHTLTASELPTHVNAITVQGANEGSGPGKLANVKKVTFSIGNKGKAAPHNNMPPYIALYFCKKD